MSTSAVAAGLIEPEATLDWTEYPTGVPVLVVDDDVEVRKAIGRSLRKFKIETVGTGTIAQARRRLKNKREQFSLVFLDKWLPDGNGVEFLDEIRRLRPALSVVIITGDGNAEEAHSSLEGGVLDYLPKPFLISTLRSVVTKRYPGLLASRDKRSVVVGPVVDGTDGVVEDDSTTKFIAHSPSMISVSIHVSRIGKIATMPPVLISGDTGSGKEVIARLIHQRSSRASEKFVGLNCGAFPTDLIESAFFGYRRGSFTGADTDRKGFFEIADGGTIFLDEITETTPAFQVKLLRVLQEGCVTPLGSTEEIKVDVRIIAATNRNLRKEIDSSGLRKDLYYRLAGCEIFFASLKRTERRYYSIGLLFCSASSAQSEEKGMVLGWRYRSAKSV
jgi:two-component system, NtrC family, response regulator PilR